MVDVVNGGITAGIGQSGQSNPLAMLGQFASTQNQLNQNALFQQTYHARGLHWAHWRSSRQSAPMARWTGRSTAS